MDSESEDILDYGGPSPKSMFQKVQACLPKNAVILSIRERLSKMK